MNQISINSNTDSFFSEFKNKNSNNKSSFEKFLEAEDYKSILEKTLSHLSDLEKESHLETLETLQKEGYTQEELITINLYILSQKENSIDELSLSDEDKELIDKYNSIFEQIKKAIQEKKEERLNLKPLQTQIFMSDTLLKTKDIIDGKEILEHSLNLEV